MPLKEFGMKNLRAAASVFALSWALVGPSAYGAVYNVDAAHSQIGFRVKHMFAKVPGRFTKFNGTFDYDPDMKTTGNFSAEIETASINTDNAKRDDHLRSADFFDAKKHPKITFKSTKVTPVDKNNFKVTGDLTMHGVTKPVDLDFEFLGEVKDPGGNLKAGFHATSTINRKDWGITWNKTLDGGNFLVGEEVELDILLEAENTAAKKKST